MEKTPVKLLQVTGLSKHFGGLPALSQVSFGAARGQVTALIGPNGAGKTTLINCLTGVIQPDGGEILFDGGNLAGLPAHLIARLGISRTFQNLRIFPRLSVLDNVLCGLTVQAGDSMLAALLRLPALRHRERRLKLTALEALDTFGLADKAGWPAGALPYGDKKRVEMARAFVAQPVLTLLDEPVAGLNSEETAKVAALIRQMRLSGRTMVLVEHDMELVMGVADHVVVLDGGRRIAAGPPQDVRTNPLVLEAYLGRMSATALGLGAEYFWFKNPMSRPLGQPLTRGRNFPHEHLFKSLFRDIAHQRDHHRPAGLLAPAVRHPKRDPQTFPAVHLFVFRLPVCFFPGFCLCHFVVCLSQHRGQCRQRGRQPLGCLSHLQGFTTLRGVSAVPG